MPDAHISGACRSPLGASISDRGRSDPADPSFPPSLPPSLSTRARWPGFRENPVVAAWVIQTAQK
eukprot:4062473-Pyramimonas_sp.AAC.1